MPMRMILFLLAVFVSAAAPMDIERKPISFLGTFEGGMIDSLVYGVKGEGYSNQVINRLGVWVDDEAVVNGRLRFRLGLGGMYFYAFPTELNFIQTEQRMFIFGISQASLDYSFGDPGNPYLKMTLGQFPLKYNQDARNLGEYLFRSSAYPLTLQTGGYIIADDARAGLLGVDLENHAWNGRMENHILFTSETNRYPLYDMSLTYLGSLHLGRALEIGGGISFDRVLPARPSFTTPRNYYYFHFAGDSIADIHDGSRKVFVPAGDYASLDTAGGAYSGSAIAQDTTAVKSLSKQYYTYQSTKLMGRLALDLKALFGLEGKAGLGEEDLRIFSEVALLGVKNYPVYFTKRIDRMPVMAGINLPAFGAADILCLQAEYLRNPYANDWSTQLTGNTPLPIGYAADHWDTDSVGHKDDWRWSVFAKKKFPFGLTVVLQVASDHLRLIDLNYNLTTRTVLTDPKRQFYYLTRLTWGF